MPITDDIRKTLTDPTPLYFAAGVIDKIREEAPERIAAVRATDPKEVQEKLTVQAKETQAKVSEVLGTVDTDIKKFRVQAQQLAQEYAVKARETYGEFADRGRGAVQTWRASDSDAQAPEVTVERAPVSGLNTAKDAPKSEKPEA